MENTVLMPHAGSATHTTRRSMVEIACKNITNFLLYNVKDNLVNKIYSDMYKNNLKIRQF